MKAEAKADAQHGKRDAPQPSQLSKRQELLQTGPPFLQLLLQPREGLAALARKGLQRVGLFMRSPAVQLPLMTLAWVLLFVVQAQEGAYLQQTVRWKLILLSRHVSLKMLAQVPQ